MNSIIDAAVARSRPVLLVLVLVLIAGSIAYVTIPKEADPDVAIPIIYILIPHDGISAEDAHERVVDHRFGWAHQLVQSRSGANYRTAGR